MQIATAAVFFGRAWQHLVWDAPYRTLLWDEGWMKSVVESFGVLWDDYITSPKTDQNIQRSIRGIGWFYILCGFAALFINKINRLASTVLWIGSLSLIILSLLYCKERFFSVGQFFEYSLQYSIPLFLIYAARSISFSKRFIINLKVVIALTFTCHGLYAIGYYPRPGYFIEMTMLILGLSEQTAVSFLKLAGVLDFIIGFGIFLPWKYSKWILMYTIFWGLMTTLARAWAYVEIADFVSTARQWVHESVYRVPHFIGPIVLYFIMESKYGILLKKSK